ncbi:hypothetical protein N6H05_09585 [Sphingobium sp. WTD-1]|uniref:hypothetical protein n=1 Tax=Sphingobium sp. WTD-1 TaxID=2979467 RepID=UPI0024DE09FF|nr:hypothetical protein [Sphingobium sp. WTD-1]WIA58021.1 hypothetical protein N6H05_09585 [Sphingobium sp. WTD-1]
MTESEKMIDVTDAIVNKLVAEHGFPVIGAILGSAAAIAVLNGREPYLREVLIMLDATIDQMVAHRKESAS